MNLPQIGEKIKNAPDIPRDAFFIVLFLLLVAIGYVGGRIYILEKERAQELRVVRVADAVPGSENKTEMNNNSLTQTKNNVPVGMKYVASKSGKVFHLPWCPGAKKIKEENKIWFSSIEEAISAGYRPAGNCDGI